MCQTNEHLQHLLTVHIVEQLVQMKATNKRIQSQLSEQVLSTSLIIPNPFSRKVNAGSRTWMLLLCLVKALKAKYPTRSSSSSLKLTSGLLFLPYCTVLPNLGTA